MTQKQIQVGIVGASAQKNWAHVSHVPAIDGLSGLRLAAVATRNEQSARNRLRRSVLTDGLPIPLR